MCFSDDIVTAGSAFTLSQALSFGNIYYVMDYNGELHLLGVASLEGKVPPMSFPLIISFMPTWRFSLDGLTSVLASTQCGGSLSDVLHAGQLSSLDCH